MLRRHRPILLTFVLASSLIQGCMGFHIKNGIPYFSKNEQWEPKVEEDKWAPVGKMARGNRPPDDERDPLKPILMSTQAQNIERNLGYDTGSSRSADPERQGATPSDDI